jgi:hypothetical protein
MTKNKESLVPFSGWVMIFQAPNGQWSIASHTFQSEVEAKGYKIPNGYRLCYLNEESVLQLKGLQKRYDAMAVRWEVVDSEFKTNTEKQLRDRITQVESVLREIAGPQPNPGHLSDIELLAHWSQLASDTLGETAPLRSSKTLKVLTVKPQHPWWHSFFVSMTSFEHISQVPPSEYRVQYFCSKCNVSWVETRR